MMYSCQPQPRINNDIETLEKVFSRSNFDIEIQHWGCFGGNSELFNVSKRENGYLLKSVRTRKGHLVSQNQIDSLKGYLRMKIGRGDEGGCTSSEYIRVGTMFNSVNYNHSHCSGIEAIMIQNLLNYEDLLRGDRK